LAGPLFAIPPAVYLEGVLLLKNFLLVIYTKMARWQCSRRKEIDDMIEQMAQEMYLRDWRGKMRDVHLNLFVKLLREVIKLKTI
jgi:hypothetical protein